MPARYAQNRHPWPAAVNNLLSKNGIRLYSHQALATDHIRAGHNVVLSTPTASGKSLVYNLSVLARHLQDPDARALYLFPLKALAQDQLTSFTTLAANWPVEARPSAALYDGDTSEYRRRKIRREPPNVLITNPEMLHLGILPHHEQWAPFLAGLSLIVVDEAHIYRGVFGSHMTQVFRRLNRLAGRYGAAPVYILCTATVGNPAELAEALVDAGLAGGGNRTPVVIDDSGAPHGPRHFVFLNPDLSPSSAAIDLLKAALARNLRSIVYCRSRRMTELISLWAGSQAGPYRNRISAYRAGFLPEERRSIEARMASGSLLCVISTSALELGIDIGGLDVCILVGYPGTVMGTLQRGGRVGRAQQASAVIMVAGEDALDQFFAKNPEEFFRRPPENAVVNPDNEVILTHHLECAAAELPLNIHEPWLQTEGAVRALAELCSKGLLLQSADGGQWLASRKRPQRLVDLRGTGRIFSIEDDRGSVIGFVDGFRAWRETHPGAVYLHRGRSYIISGLDAEQARIAAHEKRVSWFTRVRGQKNTVILKESERYSFGGCLVCRGRLRITECVTGYEKRSVSGNRLLTIVPLEAPPQIFETEGLWFVIPDTVRRDMEAQLLHFMGSIHAMEHAVIGLLPLQVMADRNDFGGISVPLHPQVGHACVFVYDGLPGGAGLTRQAFPGVQDLLATTRRLIADCSCENGCPSCVHSPKCGSGNRPISKSGAIALLDALLAHGHEGEKLCRELVITPEQPISTASPRQNGDISSLPPQRTPMRQTAYSPRFPPARYVVFDVETRRSAAEVGGWHRAGRMGVSIAVLYDSVADDFFSYTQEDLPEFFTRMRQADLVVGFNSTRFDYAVLAPFAPFDLLDLPCLDLLLRVKERLNYRVSLNNLGEATLGEPKNADGLQALAWWKEGRLDAIAAYCRKDVDLTRRLYLFGLEQGYVLFSNKAGQHVRLPVDFEKRA